MNFCAHTRKTKRDSGENENFHKLSQAFNILLSDENIHPGKRFLRNSYFRECLCKKRQRARSLAISKNAEISNEIKELNQISR